MGGMRTVEVTLFSAQQLKNTASVLTRMSPTAVVTLTGHPHERHMAGPDPSGGSNPEWNQKLLFTVDERQLSAPGTYADVELYSQANLATHLGTAYVPVSMQADVEGFYPILKHGNQHGSVRVAVRILPPGSGGPNGQPTRGSSSAGLTGGGGINPQTLMLEGARGLSLGYDNVSSLSSSSLSMSFLPPQALPESFSARYPAPDAGGTGGGVGGLYAPAPPSGAYERQQSAPYSHAYAPPGAPLAQAGQAAAVAAGPYAGALPPGSIGRESVGAGAGTAASNPYPAYDPATLAEYFRTFQPSDLDLSVAPNNNIASVSSTAGIGAGAAAGVGAGAGAWAGVGERGAHALREAANPMPPAPYGLSDVNQSMYQQGPGLAAALPGWQQRAAYEPYSRREAEESLPPPYGAAAGQSVPISYERVGAAYAAAAQPPGGGVAPSDAGRAAPDQWSTPPPSALHPSESFQHREVYLDTDSQRGYGGGGGRLPQPSDSYRGGYALPPSAAYPQQQAGQPWESAGVRGNSDVGAGAPTGAGVPFGQLVGQSVGQPASQPQLEGYSSFAPAPPYPPSPPPRWTGHGGDHDAYNSGGGGSSTSTSTSTSLQRWQVAPGSAVTEAEADALQAASLGAAGAAAAVQVAASEAPAAATLSAFEPSAPPLEASSSFGRSRSQSQSDSGAPLPAAAAAAAAASAAVAAAARGAAEGAPQAAAAIAAGGAGGELVGAPAGPPRPPTSEPGSSRGGTGVSALAMEPSLLEQSLVSLGGGSGESGRLPPDNRGGYPPQLPQLSQVQQTGAAPYEEQPPLPGYARPRQEQQQPQQPPQQWGMGTEAGLGRATAGGPAPAAADAAAAPASHLAQAEGYARGPLSDGRRELLQSAGSTRGSPEPSPGAQAGASLGGAAVEERRREGRGPGEGEYRRQGEGNAPGSGGVGRGTSDGAGYGDTWRQQQQQLEQPPASDGPRPPSMFLDAGANMTMARDSASVPSPQQQEESERPVYLPSREDYFGAYANASSSRGRGHNAPASSAGATAAATGPGSANAYATPGDSGGHYEAPLEQSLGLEGRGPQQPGRLSGDGQRAAKASHSWPAGSTGGLPAQESSAAGNPPPPQQQLQQREQKQQGPGYSASAGYPAGAAEDDHYGAAAGRTAITHALAPSHGYPILPPVSGQEGGGRGGGVVPATEDGRGGTAAQGTALGRTAAKDPAPEYFRQQQQRQQQQQPPHHHQQGQQGQQQQEQQQQGYMPGQADSSSSSSSSSNRASYPQLPAGPALASSASGSWEPRAPYLAPYAPSQLPGPPGQHSSVIEPAVEVPDSRHLSQSATGGSSGLPPQSLTGGSNKGYQPSGGYDPQAASHGYYNPGFAPQPTPGPLARAPVASTYAPPAPQGPYPAQAPPPHEYYVSEQRPGSRGPDPYSSRAYSPGPQPAPAPTAAAAPLAGQASAAAYALSPTGQPAPVNRPPSGGGGAYASAAPPESAPGRYYSLPNPGPAPAMSSADARYSPSPAPAAPLPANAYPHPYPYPYPSRASTGPPGQHPAQPSGRLSPDKGARDFQQDATSAYYYPPLPLPLQVPPFSNANPALGPALHSQAPAAHHAWPSPPQLPPQQQQQQEGHPLHPPYESNPPKPAYESHTFQPQQQQQAQQQGYHPQPAYDRIASQPHQQQQQWQQPQQEYPPPQLSYDAYASQQQQPQPQQGGPGYAEPYPQGYGQQPPPGDQVAYSRSPSEGHYSYPSQYAIGYQQQTQQQQQQQQQPPPGPHTSAAHGRPGTGSAEEYPAAAGARPVESSLISRFQEMGWPQQQYPPPYLPPQKQQQQQQHLGGQGTDRPYY